MSEVVKLVTRADIDRLQMSMREIPQLELQTNHYFADGMYCRELLLPAGTVIVGKVHKREHFFIIMQGTIEVVGDGMRKRISGPAVLISGGGTKRAGVAITDVVGLNMHRTFETDLDLIEQEMTEPDEFALYDARNELKAIEAQ